MESDKEITRARQKLTAAYRARHRLQQRFDTIDFELDTLKPKLKELQEGLTMGYLPEITIKQLPSGK